MGKKSQCNINLTQHTEPEQICHNTDHTLGSNLWVEKSENDECDARPGRASPSELTSPRAATWGQPHTTH